MPDYSGCLCGVCPACIKTIGKRPQTHWEDDGLQFPRLLCEVQAAGTPALWRDICASMDLTPSQLQELFDRAERKWNQITDALCSEDNNNRTHNQGR